jgi:hypothetical protein
MKWTEDLDQYEPYLHKKIKAGRGIGEGPTYLGWLGLRENPKKADIEVPFGLKTHRQHYLRTGVGAGYFYILERQRDVDDIREQFPILDIDSTLRICAKLKLNHKYKNFDPEPFTIDFMVTRGGDSKSYHARSLEPARGPLSAASQDTFLVLHHWCQERGIDWKPVRTAEITTTLRKSLTFIRGWHRDRYQPDRVEIESFAAQFGSKHRRSLTLMEILEDVSTVSGQSTTHLLNVFRYASWAGFLQIDLTYTLALNRVVVLKSQ